MNPNDPAVFTLEVDAKGGFLLTKGLTKRELFAAMAMQGLRAADVREKGTVARSTIIAAIALQDADALCAELNKEVTK